MSNQLNVLDSEVLWADLAPGSRANLKQILVGNLLSAGQYRSEMLNAGHPPEIVVSEVEKYEADYDERARLFKALSIAAVKMASFPLGVQTVETLQGMHLCLLPIHSVPGVAKLVFVFGDTELEIAEFGELEEFSELAAVVQHFVEEDLTPGVMVSEEVFDSYR